MASIYHRNDTSGWRIIVEICIMGKVLVAIFSICNIYTQQSSAIYTIKDQNRNMIST